ncbi:hypothetical protein C900_02934 [Fulvivirga imtechensis AK7]|uniref:GAF domain-containing protein n=1 Tax=Fulvivirga imtechensis AK7 TaxID=1237149 RepID=L8JUT1_9BACT|nr:histidine kinase [Fulvivirga imtechensis]ELR71319.1 hypothetical protein C900_02934 [Fulvivirga imtechensis AK7]
MTKRLSFDELEEVLIYFSTSILGKNTEEEILWDLAKNCISKLGFVDAVIYMLDKKCTKLIQKAAYGSKNPKSYDIYQPIDIPVGQGITGTVAQTGIAEIVKDTTKDSRYILDDEARLSEITVPIKLEDGNVIGVIDCEHPEKGYFTDQHLRILTAIASIAAVKIGRVRSEEKAREEEQKVLMAQRKMDEIKIKALHAQMNPHFVFNALNAIQHFIITNEKKPALTYLTLFSRLIRHYLNNLENETIGVADEVNMLKWYLKLQKLRYEGRFEYTIDVDTNKGVERANIPTFLVQSLVENIIEHMISQNKGNSDLSVKFDIRNELVDLEVSMRTKNNEFYSDHEPEYRERIAQWIDHVDLLNEVRQYNITRNIRDIRNSYGQVQGRVVSLTMPNLF